MPQVPAPILPRLSWGQQVQEAQEARVPSSCVSLSNDTTDC